jgi:hypothetical protein
VWLIGENGKFLYLRAGHDAKCRVRCFMHDRPDIVEYANDIEIQIAPIQKIADVAKSGNEHDN